MLVRRVLEWSIFFIYWFGFASVAIYSIYWRWLVQELKVHEKFGRWSSLGVFVLILIVLYLIVRSLALMLYAKCKVREKRLIHNMKKEVRALKADANGQTNLGYENEKQLRKSKKHQSNLNRGQSLDDLNQYMEQNKQMQSSKSLETVARHSQRHRKRNRENDFSQNSVLYYEVMPTPINSYHQNQGFNTPPPVYQALHGDLIPSDDEYEIYSKINSSRNSKFRQRKSADDILEGSRAIGALPRTSHSCDEIDEVPYSSRILRRAPPPPPPTAARRSKSLTRISNKTKANEFYAREQASNSSFRTRSLHRTRPRLQQHPIEVHRPVAYPQNKSNP